MGARLVSLDDLEIWARRSGVVAVQPQHYPKASFPESPCVDFGRFIKKEPLFVLKPDSVNTLRSCVAWLSDHEVAFKVRGAAHSSGGQVLIERGAVIDTSDLDSVVRFDPDAEVISVQGGTLWEDVVVALRPFGHIPMVWTNNLRTTVAGTLAVGGFGATSSRFGPQVDHVASLSILTPDGEVHECGPGDALFEYSLAGCGQLGIIIEARLRTRPRRFRWMGLRVQWKVLEDYIDDMKAIIEESSHDFFTAKVTLSQDRIEGFVGDMWGGGKIGEGPWPKRGQALEVVSEDLHAALVSNYDPRSWGVECVPALEFILPLDDGLPVWAAIERELIVSDVARYFKDTSPSIGVVRGRSCHPLAPLPGTDFAFGVALRPSVPLSDVENVLQILRRVASRVLDAGGRIYMMSIEVRDQEFLHKQFRDHYETFVTLKHKYDPLGLLNPGLLQAI